MKTIEEIIDEISEYIVWNNVKHIDPEANVKKMIIDYAKQEVKKQTEELELRLRMQKIHCKLFHRQKISVWLTGYWFRFKWWIKPVKLK